MPQHLPDVAFQTFTVRLPPATVKELRARAGARGVPYTAFARTLIESGLGRSLPDSEIKRLGLDS